jgi:hypothetical protein
MDGLEITDLQVLEVVLSGFDSGMPEDLGQVEVKARCESLRRLP